MIGWRLSAREALLERDPDERRSVELSGRREGRNHSAYLRVNRNVLAGDEKRNDNGSQSEDSDLDPQQVSFRTIDWLQGVRREGP